MPRRPQFIPKRFGFWSIGQPSKLGIIGRSKSQWGFFEKVETKWLDLKKVKKVK